MYRFKAYHFTPDTSHNLFLGRVSTDLVKKFSFFVLVILVETQWEIKNVNFQAAVGNRQETRETRAVELQSSLGDTT